MRICFSACPEKKKRATIATAAPKKSDVEKAQSSKAKNVGGEKKGMHNSSDSWCDYVVVSDSLVGLAPAVIVRRPKPEPKDTAAIPLSNQMIPLIWNPALSTWCERKQGKQNRLVLRLKVSLQRRSRGRKLPRKAIWMPLFQKPLPVVNEELPPSPPRASIADLLQSTEVLEGGAEKVVDHGAGKTVDAAVNIEKVTNPKTVDDIVNP
ncbi:hypothetical protein Hanom_Chr01g00042371 [Helianthus anomalus]